MARVTCILHSRFPWPLKKLGSSIWKRRTWRSRAGWPGRRAVSAYTSAIRMDICWNSSLRAAGRFIDRVFGPQRGCGDLRDVQQLRRRFRHAGQRIAEHRIAERTRSSDHVRSGGHQLFGALHADAFALLFTQEREAASGAAAKRSFSRAQRIERRAETPNHAARLIVNVAIAAQVARVVVHDLLTIGGVRG